MLPAETTFRLQPAEARGIVWTRPDRVRGPRADRPLLLSGLPLEAEQPPVRRVEEAVVRVRPFREAAEVLQFEVEVKAEG